MEKECNAVFKFKVVTRVIGSVLFAFLFSFCTLSNILAFSTNMRGVVWFLPIFVLPSNLICMTFGIDYWIGNDPIRRWSYCVSSIALTALLLLITLELEFSTGRSTLLGLVAAILLTILPILYNIQAVRKRKPVIQEADFAHPTILKHNLPVWLQAMTRVLCLLSICCVLFESWHSTIQFFWQLFTLPNIWLSNQTRNQIILSILFAILLARFMKAEFAQRNTLLD